MSTATTEDYVAKRAELLANLVLTRRKDIQVLPLDEKSDAGVDFLVRITKPTTNSPVNPYFGVIVKGTDVALEDEREAGRFANQVVRVVNAQAFLLAPLVVMVFSMEGDRGFWGWVMEPAVSGSNSPALNRPDRTKVTEVSPESLADLFSAVVAWFDAVGAVLSHHREAK
jgi:hypothetical protein